MAATQQLKSSAISDQGAEFRAAIPADWTAPARGVSTPIELQLEIVNRTAAELRFNTVDTLRIVVAPEGGEPLQFGSARNGLVATGATRSLAAGATLTVSRPGRLQWDDDGRSLRLTGTDDSGAVWHIDGLKPGKFTFSFEYENTATYPNYVQGQWTGKIRTSSVDFDIQTLEKRS